MKRKIYSLVVIWVFVVGCAFNAPASASAVSTSPFAAEFSANAQNRRRKRVRRTGRLIIHKNSGKVRRAQCRDGSISLSRKRRGTCSGHGGVRRWL